MDVDGMLGTRLRGSGCGGGGPASSSVDGAPQENK
jgi:hypothetical protein